VSARSFPLVYLAVRTAVNRAAIRLRRLRRPRYLLFALVGATWFWFVAARHWVTAMGNLSRSRGAAVPVDLVEVSAALALMLAGCVAWLLPAPSCPLPFTSAEIHHLFTAPVTRLRLLRWKLAASVPGTLLGALLLSLGAAPAVARGGWPIFLTGACIVFLTGRFHVMAARLARHRLQQKGIGWAARACAAALPAAILAGLAARQAPIAASASTLDDLQAGLAGSPLWWITAPGRWLVRPALVESWSGFAVAAVPAITLLVLHIAWVIRSRADLEEGALESSGELRAAARSRVGRRAGAGRVRLVPAPFRLAPAGPAVTALVWKGMVRMVRQTGGLHALLALSAAFLLPGIVTTISGGVQAGRLVAGACAAGLAALLALIGPALFRTDFSGELRHIGFLRSFPLSGRTLVAGMLMGPAGALAVTQWVLLAAAAALLAPSWDGPALAEMVLAAAVMAAPLNLVSAVAQNALVVLFPGWMMPGAERTSGIEMMGFNIVTGLARMILIVVCLLPAAAAFAVVWTAAWAAGVQGAGIVGGGIAAAAIISGEAVLGLELLGRWIERSDERFDPVAL
jgi:ABC-2 type transport system permease protein